ncbi:MAG: hypothetical protein DLM73_01325 [Chthoniobacterales bacterium]|nr:MAG: hypothetical protein DLM73_01325 [Chthoniobacterales bacterium]
MKKLSLAIVFALLTPAFAKTVEFPEKSPAFTFTMPDSWTVETAKDGRIYCTSEDGFKIGIVSSPAVKNTDDAKELLPKILKGMADAMKCENYKTEGPHVRELKNMLMVVMQGHGTVDGTEMSLNAIVFAPSPDNFFSIVGAAPKTLDKAHDKDMNELIRSIKAVDN